MNLSYEGDTKRLANKLLSNFRQYKIENPNAEKIDLYVKLARSNPRYSSEENIRELLEFALSLSRKRDGVLDGHVNLMWLIMAMCVIETGGVDGKISGEETTRIYSIVFRLVDEEL